MYSLQSLHFNQQILLQHEWGHVNTKSAHLDLTMQLHYVVTHLLILKFIPQEPTTGALNSNCSAAA
jgi:hypothetical protein